jgi:DNA helicase-2/ATP-dependent DNA helicase PcrA
MSDELLESLNPQQLQAVTSRDKNILILAGAGSGKTRVLTSRIAWLLREHLAVTGDILAVTFTNKAAKEMLTRLEAMLPYDLRRMWVGTFHGLCNRILRAHAEEAGLPRTFQILDQSDQLSAVKRVMKALNLSTETTDPRSLQNMINYYKESGIRANRVGAGENERFAAFYQAYEQQCQKEGVVDFAELLLRCYELLERNEIVRSHYQGRFRYILVDEFQDTNALQYRWLKLLAGQGKAPDGGSVNSVFAVGDDDQSIYAFRGARVGNMADFLKDFGVAQPIRLEQNYRSTSTILEAANALISHNEARLGKNLWTSGDRGDKILNIEFESDRDEANWIAERISENYQHCRAYRDHAVLYRTNAQSRAIEQALANRGIPYRVYGGQRFFERAEVKHVLAYLRLLDNPSDDTSFLRVVNFPARGIGAKTIEALSDEAGHIGSSLWGALESPNYKAPPKLAYFRALILKMREEAEELTLADAIKLVIVRSGLEDFYKNERDGADRIENMHEVISAASGYLENEGIPATERAFAVPEGDTPQSPLQGFLTQATLEAGDKNEQGDADAVQLMTVHAAKGLEFREVFIAGVEDGLFPHFSAVKDDSSGGLPEERRLMYVAITRAKKRLYITHCRSRMQFGEQRYNKPSEFLDEIPEELTEVKGVRPRRRSYSDGTDWENEDQSQGWGGGPAWGSGNGGRSYGRGGYSREGYGSSRGSYGRGGSGYERRDEGDWRRGLAGGSARYRAAEDPVVKRSAARSASAEYGFAPGDTVVHGKFGTGSVEKLTGSGADARAVINFKKFGRKELLLALAAKNLHKL